MTQAPASPGQTLTRVRQGLGLTRKTVARMIGVSERTVAGWENGRPPGAAGRRGIEELERLYQGLAEVVRAEYLPHWFNTPNEEFEGCKPAEALERGEMDR